MSELQIVGITGFARSGKTELLRHLTDSYGFAVVSPSDAIYARLAAQTGRTQFTRHEMRLMGNEIKRTEGADFIIKTMLARPEKRLVIDGLRNRIAARSLVDIGGHIMGLVARPEVRLHRAHSSGDHKCPPQDVRSMVADEAVEMNSLDSVGMHILPILWQLDPDNIIDTSELTIEETHQAADVLLERWGIHPLLQAN